MSRIHTTSPLYVFLIFLFAGILSSCSSDDLPVCTDGAILTLEIGLPGEEAIVTRATEEGVATLNENTINSVDLFRNYQALYSYKLTFSFTTEMPQTMQNLCIPFVLPHHQALLLTL